MEEFSKFSIKELNTTCAILDEFQKINSPDPSLKNVEELITEEINFRNNRNEIEIINDINKLKAKILGKYFKVKRPCSCDNEVVYFKVNNVKYRREPNWPLDTFCIVTINTNFVIYEYQECDSYLLEKKDDLIIYTLSPTDLDISDFFEISEDEFKEKLKKIIKDELA